MLPIPNADFKLNFQNSWFVGFFLDLSAAESFVSGFIHKSFFYFSCGYVFTVSKMVLKYSAIFGVGNEDEDCVQGSSLPDPPGRARDAGTVRNKTMNVTPCSCKCLPPSPRGPGNPTAWRIAVSPHTLSPQSPNPQWASLKSGCCYRRASISAVASVESVLLHLSGLNEHLFSSPVLTLGPFCRQ